MFIEQKLKDYIDLSVEEIEEKLTQTRVVKFAVDETQQSKHEINAAIIEELVLTVALKLKIESIQQWQAALHFLEGEIKELLNVKNKKSSM